MSNQDQTHEEAASITGKFNRPVINTGVNYSAEATTQTVGCRIAELDGLVQLTRLSAVLARTCSMPVCTADLAA